MAQIRTTLHHIISNNLSNYEMVQILGISAFDKTPIKELLTEFLINQNVKDQLNLFSSNY